MNTPIQDFGRIVRQVFRFGRAFSYGAIVVMVVLLAFRVADVYEALARVDPLLGVAFLLALGLFLSWFVGRPVYRFLRLPRVMRVPRLPPRERREPRHLARHLAYVERYVRALPSNPEWSGEVAQVEACAGRCRALAARALVAGPADLVALEVEATEIDRKLVAPLVAPLDRRVSDLIRAEAYRVGLATAVSPYGTLDAFIVLWRNANLVSRIAHVYYGRPGPRGSLRVLRDVSLAAIAGAYLQDLGHLAGEFVGALAGKTAGFFAGPLMEGCLNAVATLRIGYLAKARCRAFQEWNEKTAADAARQAMIEAGHLSAGVVTDLVRTVGGGLLKIPARILGGVLDRLTGLFRKPAGPAPEAAG